MIECLIDGHKDIFYNENKYAEHLLKYHKTDFRVKLLIRWAKRKLKSNPTKYRLGEQEL